MYREMTIGTAVPSPEQLSRVRHYFVQTISVRDPYSAGQYEADALWLIRKLFGEGHEVLVMCGGSGFYIDAVCNGTADLPEADPALRSSLKLRLREEGISSLQTQFRQLDPEGYASTDISNPARVVRALEICLQTGKPFSSFKAGFARKRDFGIEKICLTRPAEELYRRIDQRVLGMIDAGLVDEARSLLPLRGYPALQTVGYQELFALFDAQAGLLPTDLPMNATKPDGISSSVWPIPRTLDDAIALIQRNTRHYAKKQLTWWRRDSSVRWLNL